MRKKNASLGQAEIRGALAGIFLIAFGLRLVFVMTIDRTVWGDEPSYLWLARNFFSGNGYQHYFGIADTLYPPGFPLLVGLVQGWMPHLAAASSFWYVVAGTATVLPIFLLGKAIYGPAIALLASLLYAISPAMLAGTFFGGTLTEPPYLFFLFSGIYFTHLYFKHDRMRDALLSGLCLGYAYLIRTEGYLCFLLFLLLRLLWLLWDYRTDWRKAYKPLLLFIGGFALFASPYVLYLHSVLGRWTFSGQSTQSYIAAKALLTDDPTRYDLETWGLDPRGREVRIFSQDLPEIPLLTLFFDDPVLFARDLFINAGRSMDLLFAPGFLGALLMLIAIVGLVGVPWDHRRAMGEILLLLSLLPLISYWNYYVLDRHLYPAVPILLFWVARGLVHLSRWIDRTGENLAPLRTRRRPESWLKNTGMLLIVFHLLLVNYRICRDPYAPHIYELKTVARWIYENTLPTAVIMSRQPEIAFHANREWIVFPHAPYPECMKYARSHGADYWVFESDIIRTRRPHLIPYMEARRETEGLEEVYRMEIPPNKTYVVFKMESRRRNLSPEN